jgi:hypothetical protein
MKDQEVGITHRLSDHARRILGIEPPYRDARRLTTDQVRVFLGLNSQQRRSQRSSALETAILLAALEQDRHQ